MAAFEFWSHCHAFEALGDRLTSGEPARLVRHPQAAPLAGLTTADVLSGNLALSNVGAFQMSVVYRVAGQSTSVTNVLAGHYTRQGNNLSFSYSNGGTNGGTLSADTLRMTNEGVVWLFTRT